MVSVLRYFDETRQWSQVDAGQISNLPSSIPSGSVMAFYQTTTPVGWTRVTTFDDALPRIVGSATPGSGGTNAFSIVNAQTGTGTGTTGTGTSGATTLSTAQIPGHTHPQEGDTLILSGTSSALEGCTKVPNNIGGTTQSTGGGGSHTHTIPGLSVPSLSVSFNIRFVDSLLASKN